MSLLTVTSITYNCITYPNKNIKKMLDRSIFVATVHGTFCQRCTASLSFPIAFPKRMFCFTLRPKGHSGMVFNLSKLLSKILRYFISDYAFFLFFWNPLPYHKIVEKRAAFPCLCGAALFAPRLPPLKGPKHLSIWPQGNPEWHKRPTQEPQTWEGGLLLASADIHIHTLSVNNAV